MNIIVSPPRSGQHLIEKILNYCCREHNVEFTHCEFYSCCNSIPCVKGKTTSKNHDFNLDLEINNNIKYISLYRGDIILQLESYYRYNSKVEGKKYKYEDLLTFIKKKSNYYNNFVNKWINNENENILKIEYYELIKDPENICKRIFNHFFPDVEIKDDVFKNLLNMDIEVDGVDGRFYHKIGLINKLDDEIYNKLKEDLGI